MIMMMMMMMMMIIIIIIIIIIIMMMMMMMMIPSTHQTPSSNILHSWSYSLIHMIIISLINYPLLQRVLRPHVPLDVLPVLRRHLQTELIAILTNTVVNKMDIRVV